MKCTNFKHTIWSNHLVTNTPLVTRPGGLTDVLLNTCAVRSEFSEIIKKNNTEIYWSLSIFERSYYFAIFALRSEIINCS